MTKRSRRPHSAAFKARLALASLKEDATMAELAARVGVPPSQIQVWRKQLVESAAAAGTGAEGFGAGVEGIAREDRSTDDGAGFSVGKVVALARPERTALMDAGAKLARKRQCELLQVSRASWYRRSTPREAEVRLKHRLDQLYPKRPYLGSRRLTVALRRDGETINRKRVQRLMRELKLQAVYPKPRTTRPEPTHARYP